MLVFYMFGSWILEEENISLRDRGMFINYRRVLVNTLDLLMECGTRKDVIGDGPYQLNLQARHISIFHDALYLLDVQESLFISS